MSPKTGTVQSVEVLKSTVNRRYLRYFLRRFSSKCKKDRRSRVEVALELFSGERNSACWTCSHIARPIVEWAIRRGGEAFGVDKARLVEKFKNVYWRRGLLNVLLGIAKFGARRPFIPGSPFLVVWNFTQRCNLQCLHCYASAGNPHPEELDTREALTVVDKLADAGVNVLALSGGEPLMRKDFFEVLEASNSHGIFTALATNGTLITRDVAKKLKDSGVGYVQVSLDGATHETHDSFRGVPEAFERAIRGIKNCVEQEMFVEVATTATRFNYKEIPDVIDLCEKLGANWWMMYNFVPTGRGRFLLENDLKPEEREMVLQTLWQRLRSNSKFQVLATAPQYSRVAIQMEEKAREKAEGIVVPTHFYNPHLHGQLMELSSFIGGCGAGRFYCAIDYDGTITPCVFFPLKLGNIKVDSFEEVWNNHPVLWDLRDRDKLKDHCGHCEYRYVCGGCRARAYGYLGDYLAPDPGCVNNKKEWDRLLGEDNP